MMAMPMRRTTRRATDATDWTDDGDRPAGCDAAHRAVDDHRRRHHRPLNRSCASVAADAAAGRPGVDGRDGADGVR